MKNESPHLRCIRKTPETLADLIELAPPEKLVWKPAPDRWSICEVLNHLTDVEKLSLGLRAKRILDEEMPLFVDYDQKKRYRDGAYANDDGERALQRFRETRKTSLSWLERIQPSDWTRRGTHHVVGEVELSQILSLWAFHDLGHIRQIAELVKAISFWDGIGSLQTYYSVRP
ncbi:MAG: DinB family protein [Vicinamibacteria bacterium]